MSETYYIHRRTRTVYRERERQDWQIGHVLEPLAGGEPVAETAWSLAQGYERVAGCSICGEPVGCIHTALEPGGADGSGYGQGGVATDGEGRASSRSMLVYGSGQEGDAGLIAAAVAGACDRRGVALEPVGIDAVVGQGDSAAEEGPAGLRVKRVIPLDEQRVKRRGVCWCGEASAPGDVVGWCGRGACDPEPPPCWGVTDEQVRALGEEPYPDPVSLEPERLRRGLAPATVGPSLGEPTTPEDLGPDVGEALVKLGAMARRLRASKVTGPDALMAPDSSEPERWRVRRVRVQTRTLAFVSFADGSTVVVVKSWGGWRCRARKSGAVDDRQKQLAVRAVLDVVDDDET